MADNKQHEPVEEILIHKAELMQQRPFRRWHANFGLIASLGGVIIVPILLGIFGGDWLDNNYPQHFSWRLSGLFLGFTWGLLNGYFWLKIENDKIEKMNMQQQKGQNDE